MPQKRRQEIVQRFSTYTRRNTTNMLVKDSERTVTIISTEAEYGAISMITRCKVCKYFS